MNALTYADLDMALETLRKDMLRPLRWLGTGRRQTLLGALWPRLAPLPQGEELLVDTEPGTRVVCHCHFQQRAESDTALVIVHGLGGSSASGHVIDIARHAIARGLHVVRMNMRNCGGTEHLTPTLYHSNQWQDLDAVVRRVLEDRRVRRIVLAGYSIGANLVLNTLAHWGAEAPQVAGAVALCPAIDVNHCVSLVDAPGNALYRRHFVRELVRLYRRKAALFPMRYSPERVEGVGTLREFDRRVSSPEAGFDDVDQFYAWVSSASRLERVGAPTLVIQALDDPVVELLPDTRARIIENPTMRIVESAGGGHCGFLEWPSLRRPDGRWAAYQIARFAALAA